MYAGDALARQRHGLGLLTLSDSEEYKANADRAIKAYFKYNPVMMAI